MQQPYCSLVLYSLCFLLLPSRLFFIFLESLSFSLPLLLYLPALHSHITSRKHVFRVFSPLFPSIETKFFHSFSSLVISFLCLMIELDSTQSLFEQMLHKNSTNEGRTWKRRLLETWSFVCRDSCWWSLQEEETCS
jgi:hypothetical protein